MSRNMYEPWHYHAIWHVLSLLHKISFLFSLYHILYMNYSLQIAPRRPTRMLVIRAIFSQTNNRLHILFMIIIWRKNSLSDLNYSAMTNAEMPSCQIFRGHGCGLTTTRHWYVTCSIVSFECHPKPSNPNQPIYIFNVFLMCWNEPIKHLEASSILVNFT